MIVAKGVEKSFGAKRVLRGIDLEIPTGQTLVIIGGSGCGKSTFLKCVIGLHRPTRGQVLVDDVDVGAVSDERSMAELRRRFGYLFQEAALFDSLSVWENVVFGLKYLRPDVPAAKYRSIAAEKLALVGLKGIEDNKPAELSGGMKKRVGLARAIAAEPDTILYDEPTTGLDPIMSDVINDLIMALKKKLGVTSIAVTHDMRSAYKIADRIAMFHEGKVLECGTPDQIRATKSEAVRQFIEGRSEGPIQMKLRDYE
ncbi:MAG: ABC transporter ATP-binding protein [Elusimicrobia bacterium]|nr:ABC transporter ATP-binding protein [Elusimicrobiota bacterium]